MVDDSRPDDVSKHVERRPEPVEQPFHRKYNANLQSCQIHFDLFKSHHWLEKHWLGQIRLLVLRKPNQNYLGKALK